ncbi:MAG: DUF2249 domain-containing protein [Opitutales bacterium]|nr:DUF2249 domain-containing protein [Opitutales bacterium]
MTITEETIDVRPILAEGGCPFDTVTEKARSMNGGGKIILIAPFNPIPIYEALDAIGFKFIQVSQEEDGFYVEFESMPVTQRKLASDVDLTDLEPPQPMMKTMEIFENLEVGNTFRIKTRFKPVHLLGQLEEKDCLTESAELEDGTWHTWILKRGVKKCEH